MLTEITAGWRTVFNMHEERIDVKSVSWHSLGCAKKKKWEWDDLEWEEESIYGKGGRWWNSMGQDMEFGTKRVWLVAWEWLCEKPCWTIVKYKWKMREKPDYREPKKMELRMWVGSRTPVWVLRWAWGLWLAAGYRMGWNQGMWWGLELGRPAGQLLQESTPQRGGVLVLGETNKNVKSSPKNAFRGQNETFVMENAVQRREKMI